MSPGRFLFGAALAVVALSAACTSTIALPKESSSTGGAGGTSSTGGGGGTTVSSSGGGGITTDDPTTSKDCQPWVDRPSPGSETLRFVNQTGQPLYLPALCDGSVSFSLTTPNSPQSYTYVYDTSCLQTCQMLQTEAPYACGVCMPTTILLADGASRDVVWNGLALEPSLMEPDCFATPSSGGTCEMKVPAPLATSYTATGTAYGSCEGSCSCDAQGVCAGSPGGQALQATATFAFPEGGMAELVFSSSAVPDGG